MKQHYTNQQLYRHTVRDLCNDARAARKALDAPVWHDMWPKSEEVTYLGRVLDQIRAVFKARHTPGFVDRYGWPVQERRRHHRE